MTLSKFEKCVIGHKKHILKDRITPDRKKGVVGKNNSKL